MRKGNVALRGDFTVPAKVGKKLRDVFRPKLARMPQPMKVDELRHPANAHLDLPHSPPPARQQLPSRSSSFGKGLSVLTG